MDQHAAIPPPTDLWSFHGSDQLTILWLLACAAAGILAFWAAHGGLTGDLIPIDHASRIAYHPRIDLNSCDWPELCLLPGVSETLARRIVAARRQRGPFQCAEDLDQIPGIGPRIIQRIAPRICLTTDSTIGSTPLRSPRE